MPKKKTNTYEIEGMKFKSWAAATAKATEMSLDRGDPVTIIEYGQTGTYYISIQANSEPA